MTRPSGSGGDAEPWRYPPRVGGPRRDLGPAAETSAAIASRHPLLNARRAADEFVLDAVEIAAVLAEEIVHSHLSTRRRSTFRGRSSVCVRFLDAATLASFRRTRSVRAVPGESSWRLARRWQPAGGDGLLDEAMCGAVARYLNHDFADLLVASVITWVG